MFSGAFTVKHEMIFMFLSGFHVNMKVMTFFDRFSCIFMYFHVFVRFSCIFMFFMKIVVGKGCPGVGSGSNLEAIWEQSGSKLGTIW